MECLDDNAASEFASGSMPPAAMSKVEAHLAGCRDCRALVAALAGTEADSQVETKKHEKMSESGMGRLPPKKLAIGDRVGRYLVLSTLGAGGMGVVFSAYDPQLDRKVALKLLRANLGGTTSEARKRLRREAQAIAQLNHPNVVGVYDVGSTDDGDVYIAMEFVEGDTLRVWLERWPRTWREIVDVFAQAARGLVAAHSVGLLHRDFKPDNVLVGGDGRVRVTDFGLARSVLAPEDAQQPAAPASALHAELTATGAVLGTPRYMPPEQLTGESIDARSDQFSFCVALYEALYGAHPLPGTTATAMLEHGEKASPPPENSRVPAVIGRAVMRGLERDRGKRFPAMSALIAELSPRQERSRVRALATAAVAFVLLGGATAAVWSWQPDRAPPPRDETAADNLRAEVAALKQEVLVEREARNRAEKELIDREGDLDKLQQVIVEKNTKIEKLLVRIATVEAKLPTARLPPADKAYTAALESVQRDMLGCFDEWYQRASYDPTTRRHKTLSEVDLIVTLGVTPDGLGTSEEAVVRGEPDDTGLKFCVASNVHRVRYPKSDASVDLQISVHWIVDSPVIGMGAHVTDRHAAPTSHIDL